MNSLRWLALVPFVLIFAACDDVSRDDGSVEVTIVGEGAVRIDTLGRGTSGYTELALYPIPAIDHVFDRWEGAAGGHDSPVIVPLAGRTRIDAVFIPIPEHVEFDGIPFAHIPEGEFRMGSTFPFSDEREQPVHTVVISRPFFLSAHEVTQEVWTNVMGYNPSPIVAPERPVTGTSWFEVQDFVAAMNVRAGTSVYRLPREAEWEYACRAGTTTAFYHGDDEARLGDHAWYFDNWEVEAGLHDVGLRRPNRFGLYDMLGNAWEWVQDAFDPNYYAVSPGLDPLGPPHATFGRVIRGGGDSGIEWARCSARGNEFPEVNAPDIGFRLVRVIP